MLILTRNRGERIIIGDNTLVTVERVYPDHVRISIQDITPIHNNPEPSVSKENLFKRIQNRFKPTKSFKE